MLEWRQLQEEFELGCEECYEWLEKEYSKISSGRVNPNMFNSLKVIAYGEPIPMQQLANVQVVDSRQLLIKPFDRSLLKDIAKAITESNFNVNPQIDADCIRIVFAALTEETRKLSVKKAKDHLEQTKLKIRSVRQDVQSMHKKAEGVSEDVIRHFEDELNKATKEANAKAEGMFNKKSHDLMTL